tara:strand:+ start:632 stop:1318 length:687 start_codon:yes stop_codon:yes gene_type:complete
MSLDFSIFVEYGPRILIGFWLTIKIVFAAIVIGLPISLLLVFARRSRLKIISWIAVSYIEIFRNTPFIIQVFLIYYVLPFYGLRLPAEQVGILALAAFGSAYFAEVIRGGIDAMPTGQLESARAIGMTEYQAMRYIVLPQAVGVILPALSNQMLSLVKESAILSTITVQEMTMTAIRVQGETFRPFEAFIMIAALYWTLNETIAYGLRKFEKGMTTRKQRVVERGNNL